MGAQRGEAQAFLQHALSFTEDRCLLWPYAVDGHGYPTLNCWRKAHAIVCEAEHGPAPDGTEVAHSCGIRRCISRRHVRWDTRAGNLADKLKHGTDMRGEKHHNVALTAESVRAVRASDLKGVELATRYGVSQQTICDIRKRRSWAWL
jgi:hypothetical protein